MPRRNAVCVVKFQAHHWPMWGNATIIDYWKKQRDLYK